MPCIISAQHSKENCHRSPAVTVSVVQKRSSWDLGTSPQKEIENLPSCSSSNTKQSWSWKGDAIRNELTLISVPGKSRKICTKEERLAKLFGKSMFLFPLIPVNRDRQRKRDWEKHGENIWERQTHTFCHPFLLPCLSPYSFKRERIRGRGRDRVGGISLHHSKALCPLLCR